MVRELTLSIALGLSAGVACAPAAPVCAPNSTQDCRCGPLSGSQTCNAEGLGYTLCNCDGGPVGVDNVAPPPPDAPPPPPPACGAATTCAACTPMSGCGWCNGRCVAGTATGSSDGACAGAAWAWLSNQCPGATCATGPENTAAACGDGCDNDGDGYVDCNDFNCCGAVACGPTTSCGRRAMCTACSATGGCPAGFECARRRCDARAACYPAGDPNASCDTVDGAACPATAAYDRCTGDAACGPLATCSVGANSGYGWTVARCNHTLGCQGMAGPGCSVYGANPCPQVPSSFAGVTAVCAVTGDSLRGPCYGCVLQCAAGATCPYGLRCVGGRCVDGGL